MMISLTYKIFKTYSCLVDRLVALSIAVSWFHSVFLLHQEHSPLLYDLLHLEFVLLRSKVIVLHLLISLMLLKLVESVDVLDQCLYYVSQFEIRSKESS
jgi:hypothetical protein